jgi:PHD/YefM family antitoxin component YafN of YafNO toxin-antitoxin module
MPSTSVIYHTFRIRAPTFCRLRLEIGVRWDAGSATALPKVPEPLPACHFLRAAPTLPRRPVPSRSNDDGDLREVRSVTEFQRNLKRSVGRLKEKKTPLVLTVNGRAEVIVQDAGSYQALLDRLERAETAAATCQGMEEFERGGGMALEQAERRLRKRHGLSR